MPKEDVSYDEDYNVFDDYDDESSDIAKRTISFASDELSFELDDDDTTDKTNSKDEVVTEESDSVEPAKVDLSGIDMSTDSMTLEDDGTIEKDDIISSEEKLRLFSDKIMSAIVNDSDIKKYAIDKLMSFTSPKLFRDENYVLFSIYYFYRSKLRVINIDGEFIRLFLNRNRKLLIQSKEYIDINSYGDIDGSAELGYIAGVIKHFNRLKTFPDMSRDEFETFYEKYLIEFKAIEANKVFRQSQIILTEGLKIGRRTYIGFDDSQSYCKKRLAEIEGLVDNNMGMGFTRMSEALMNDKSDSSNKAIKICDFGKISTLNDIYGGIYTGLFYSYVAPPKSGKSKLLTRLCHNAIMNGQNVSVWAHEGGNDLWNCQMRAIHFDYIYNTGVDVTERKFGVDQDTILRDNFRTDELRQLELSSKLDLASNQCYGSVDLIDRPFNVETFLDDIDTSVKGNGSKMVLIDYLQLIGSSGNKNERERIAEAYKELLKYCRKNNVAVISPAQYKQDIFDDMIKRSSVDNADLRTAAGGSSEVLRTPDILFALWATVEDLRNNSMKIISLPSRMSRAFPNVNLRIDLGSCQFISVD